MVRVKICGLTRPEDAEFAAGLGADALGFIFEPSSPRYVGGFEPEWFERLPPWPLRIAVFGRERALGSQGRFDGVQAVEATGEIAARIRLQVYRFGSDVPVEARSDALAASAVAAQDADVLVLDTVAGPGVYGGTGAKVDWSLAAEVVRQVGKPVMLAGGLTPENVAEAIQKVRPFAVDVSSGVEAEPGVKDRAKIRDFIQAAKESDT